MQKRILLLFIVSLFLFSCSQNPTEPERREVIILFDVREDEFVMLTIYDQFDMLVKVLINDDLLLGLRFFTTFRMIIILNRPLDFARGDTPC